MDEPFQPGGRAPAPPPLDLVQDFVNTEIPDWARDDLETPELLERWLRDRGLLHDEEQVEAEGFVAARAFRAALRRLALANTLGESPDRDLLAKLSDALAPVTLRVAVDGAARVRLVPGGVGVERALATLAAVVLEAQASGAWSRVKACRQETCGWLFYDASRNLSSSWCSMSICGNRTKSAAYRSRRRRRS